MAEGMREVGGSIFGTGDIDLSDVVQVVRRATRKRSKKTVRRTRKSYTRKRKTSTRTKRKRRKSTSKKRVGVTYYTKRGQPYKILRSGKARFIKGKRRKR
jgi:hypothetical protein